MSEPIKALALIGMMGSGKSTLAREIGSATGWPWLDLDREVERRAGRSIEEIFRMEDEVGFRRWEHETLEWVVAHVAGPYVLATGGGTPAGPGNRSVLRSHFRVAWVDASCETLYHRALGPDRPLLQKGPEFFDRLCAERRSVYADLAELRVDVETASPADAAQNIVAWWKGL